MAPSTYYDAKTRPPSARARRDAVLGPALVALWEDNYRVYGVRKLWKAARRAGHDVGRDQVGRLMRAAGIEGVRRGKRVRTTKPDPAAARHPDLVKRKFTATAPNQLWVTDLTFVPTWAGVAYVCFIVDAYSRMIVGWRVASHMRTTMVLDALEMARWSRGNTLPGLTCHSDAGSQFTSIRYGERLAEIGAVPSIGTIGDSYDNALAETVNGYYKAELIYGPARTGPWKTVEDVELATLGWVTGTTPPASTATSTTSRRPSSKPRSTMHNGPTNPWSKSNSPSLRQNQGDSVTAPVLAVGDGALGFWKAMREVFPATREQRCWFHKQANVLAALPKSAHPAASAAIKDIYNAEDIDKAQVALKAFEVDYGAKYPKAVAKIVDDADVLLEFYKYPAEHWIHLRTTNPIESTFATVRLRTKVTKGPGSRAAGIAMAYKLIDAAQARWRAVNAPHLVALVRAGAVFHKGKLLERPIDITPPNPTESTETEVA